ncbi:MAG: hypothetical protein WAT39_15355 [Planctomycetota bacterium]
MNFLRTLDLYKAIVLLSLVLLPVGGWMIKTVDDTIVATKKAIADASRQGGVLEQIGTLQKKVEVVVKDSRGTKDAIRDARGYFEGQILVAGGANLKPNDFAFAEPPAESGTMPSSKQRYTDSIVDVTWTRKDPVQMDFVYAVMFNCESGSRAAGDEVQQSVWKLRELQLVNATDDRLFSSVKTPPPELSDKWAIKQMKFARREPRKGN